MLGSTNTRQRMAFGLSGFADNAMGTFIGVHLFMFYTDVVGLAPLWVSAGLAVAIVWDALCGLAMGRLSDRTRWKSGRRRPYILLGALPVGLAFALLMSPPAWLGGNLGVYFTVVLLLLFTARTVVQVPTLSLLPELAKESDARTQFAASREQLGNVGDLVGLLVPIGFVMALGAAEEGAPVALARSAFGWAGLLIASLASLALLVTFAGTREDRDVPAPRDVPMRDVLKALANNRPFRALLGASAIAALALAFVQSMILYVLEHVMQEHRPEVQLGAFVVNAVAAIASYPLWTRYTARVGKPTAFRTGLGLSAVAFSSVFIIGPGNYLGLALVMVFSGAANVGFWMLLSALNADVTELDARMHGERREGLFAGFAGFVRKLSGAGAAAGVGLGLTLIGYQEHVAPSVEVVFRLKLLFAVPTTLLLFIAMWIFRGYDSEMGAQSMTKVVSARA
jgi:GPH family glycoside/pentoside/hexuronide:cation symporter